MFKKIDIEKDGWEKLINKEEEYLLYKGQFSIGRLVPNNVFQVKDVKTIINEEIKYRIPSYQRGYRWDRQQVIELLDDIWLWDSNTNLSKQDNTSGEKSKYCL